MTYMETAADSFFGCSRCELIISPFMLSMMKQFVSLVKMSITPAESSGLAAFWFFGLVITALFWGLTWNAIDVMGEWPPDKESVRNIIDNDLISSIATWNKDQDSKTINSLFTVLTSTSVATKWISCTDKADGFTWPVSNPRASFSPACANLRVWMDEFEKMKAAIQWYPSPSCTVWTIDQENQN